VDAGSEPEKKLTNQESNMREKLRQLRFPKEFRIAPPAWNSDELSTLQQALFLLQEQGEEKASTPAPDSAQKELLRDMATGLWRIRQKMVEPESNNPLPGMQKAYRHLQSTWDVLSEAGVQIQDHTGAPYDPGLSLSVVAHQPTPGLTREIIIETIKPSVYFNNVMIQMGEVVVGTPGNRTDTKDRAIQDK
jgi:hypothetical protein